MSEQSRNRSAASYAGARLFLGMSTVGAMVVASSLALGLNLPERAVPEGVEADSPLLALAAFVLLYAVAHLPFDFLGGYFLPRRHGRVHPSLARFSAILARGVTVQSAVMFGVAALLLVGGRAGGVGGTVCAGVVAAFLLLSLRGLLARLAARLVVRREETSQLLDKQLLDKQLLDKQPLDKQPLDKQGVDRHTLDKQIVSSEDPGFTGGILGVFRPSAVWLPSHWREQGGDATFRWAERRRELTSRSRSWSRGRSGAAIFTLTGLVLAAFLVGGARLGTAVGTIEFSLFFTLWSFLGLLLLPTLSRRGVAEIDAKLRESGNDAGFGATVERIDAIQDGERSRRPLVETIFHPIPSVDRRLEPGATSGRGYWDVARTSVYLGTAGLSLLGRAVHCNCGRPALWVMLPVD